MGKLHSFHMSHHAFYEVHRDTLEYVGIEVFYLTTGTTVMSGSHRLGPHILSFISCTMFIIVYNRVDAVSRLCSKHHRSSNISLSYSPSELVYSPPPS